MKRVSLLVSSCLILGVLAWAMPVQAQEPATDAPAAETPAADSAGTEPAATESGDEAKPEENSAPAQAPAADATDLQPIAVACLRGHQNLVNDLRFVGESTGIGDDQKNSHRNRFMKQYMGKFLGQLLNAKDLDLENFPGIDGARPWGAAVMTDGLTIVPLAFLPVTDMAQFIETVKLHHGDIVKELDGGLYEVALQLPMYAKLVDGWAFFVQTEDQFESLPDPMTVLGDLPSKHDATLRIDVQNIPEVLRDLALDLLNQGEAGPLGQVPPETRAVLEFVFQQMQQVTVGVSIDTEQKQFVFDTDLKPIAGSDAESFVASLSNTKTRLGALVHELDEKGASKDNARIIARLSMPLVDAVRSQCDQMLETYKTEVLAAIDASTDVKDDEERKIFKELTEQMMGVFHAATQTGTLDMGIKLTGADKSMTLVAGAYVGEGTEADALIRRVAELGTGDPGIKLAQAEVEMHGETAIHAFEFAPATGQQGQLLEGAVGPAPKMFLAVTKDGRMFAAVGPEALARLKTAIDTGEATAPPAQLLVDIRAMLPVLQAALPQEAKIAVSLMQMNLRQGDARMIATLESQGDVLHLHGEAHEGMVRLTALLTPMIAPILLDQLKSLSLPGLSQ
ncbi:MAG: hypothetical protein K1X74_15410 [Pirellulales bacterium]|nr:hypothetical protein [Pirellulales bacterium]